ncbi:hypothetical protein GN958_ATG13984 [Phytophthora infestans]|uniref:Uncharacterized protein n=1 Tax=Phytophthora infestans TaxID=4787 RepID=A0A8S9U6Y0_PHYIN|nr:hypothetical protein GN958_ATG13984 [Phytophthora infestans]
MAAQTRFCPQASKPATGGQEVAARARPTETSAAAASARPRPTKAGAAAARQRPRSTEDQGEDTASLQLRPTDI